MANSTSTITLRLVAQDLASGNISKAIGKIDKMAAKGGLMGSVFQGVGIQMGMMLNPLMLASKGFGMVTDAVGHVVNISAEFDEAMTKSLAIMGDVSDELRGNMSDAAREVAKTTTFSAKEAADAYFYLASAGLDATQSIAAMPKVAAFAQAGAFDLATATDLLTDAQSALGLTIRDDVIKNMENMAHVSDVLVKANTLANATVEQFSESLTNKAGAALRLVNKDIEEGAAFLAVWADQGVKGADAGTRLDIVFRELQTKAITNASAFEELGVTVFDAAGKMVSGADIVEDLTNALGDMSDMGRRAALMQLGFTAKSVAATASLFGTSDALRTYERELRKAAGTTKSVADKQLDTLNAQMALLKSGVDDLALSLGESLVPALKDMVEYLNTDGIPGLQTFSDILNLDLPAISSRSNVEGMRKDFESLASSAGFSAEEITAAWAEADQAARVVALQGLEKRNEVVKGLVTSLHQLAQQQYITGDSAAYAAAEQEVLAAAIKLSWENAAQVGATRSMGKINDELRKQRRLRRAAADADKVGAFHRAQAAIKELRDEKTLRKSGKTSMEQWITNREKEELAQVEVTTKVEETTAAMETLGDTTVTPTVSTASIDAARRRINALRLRFLEMNNQTIVTTPTAPRPGGDPGGATGAIVTRPTRAIIGEAGPEAVIPLSSTRGNSPLPGGIGGTFVYAPTFSTASPAEAQRFAQEVTPYLERERSRIA